MSFIRDFARATAFAGAKTKLATVAKTVGIEIDHATLSYIIGKVEASNLKTYGSAMDFGICVLATLPKPITTAEVDKFIHEHELLIGESPTVSCYTNKSEAAKLAFDMASLAGHKQAVDYLYRIKMGIRKEY